LKKPDQIQHSTTNHILRKKSGGGRKVDTTYRGMSNALKKQRLARVRAALAEILSNKKPLEERVLFYA
jgi:hypothetical protein